MDVAVDGHALRVRDRGMHDSGRIHHGRHINTLMARMAVVTTMVVMAILMVVDMAFLVTEFGAMAGMPVITVSVMLVMMLCMVLVMMLVMMTTMMSATVVVCQRGKGQGQQGS